MKTAINLFNTITINQHLDTCKATIREILGTEVLISYKVVQPESYAAKIIDSVCQVCNITKEDLRSHKGARRFTDPRHLVCWFLKKRLTLSLKSIGGKINKDHSTVIYGIRKVNGFIFTNDTAFCDAIRQVEEKLKQH